MMNHHTSNTPPHFRNPDYERFERNHPGDDRLDDEQPGYGPYAFGRTGYGGDWRAPGDSGAWFPHSQMGAGNQWMALLRDFLTHNPLLRDVQEDVEARQRGRIALLSRSESLNRATLAQLRGQPPLPPATSAIQNEGLFTLVHLTFPDDAPHPLPVEVDFDEEDARWARSTPPGVIDATLLIDDVLQLTAGSDCVLYSVRSAAGWQAQDAHWLARLRATGRPMLIVACCQNEAEMTHADTASWVNYVRRVTGLQPLLLAEHWSEIAEQTADTPALQALAARLLGACPQLAIPLAREIPACRPAAVRQIIRTSALMTALLGAEPVPLLDLPFHVAMHWKMMLQLGIIYGRPRLDVRSAEMLGAITLNLMIRYLAQQGVKLVPMVGWMASAVLSSSSTWLLGQALVRYYEQNTLDAPDVVRQARSIAHNLGRQMIDAVSRRLGRTLPSGLE